MSDDLPIIQKTYDLIKWYVPILHRLPRDYRFTLGDRMIAELYGLLEALIQARYAREKLTQLRQVNAKLDIRLTQSVRSWAAHLKHGDTGSLRGDIFSQWVFVKHL